jgi:hypothetical protein
VFGVVKRSLFQNIMPKQEEVTFIKSISTFQLSPAPVRDLRVDLPRREKKTVLLAGGGGTTSGGWARPPTNI